MKALGQLSSALIIFTLMIVNANAQDAHFSQFYSNPAYLNPSHVGMSGANRIVAAHRQQGSESYGYASSIFSLDAPMGSNSGWGIQMVNDNQMNQVLTSTSYAASLGHRVQLNKNSKLGFGVQVGVYQKKLDWGSLTFEDQIDQRNGVVTNTQERFGNNNITQADVNVGVSYSSQLIFGGVKISHINKPRENFAIESETTIPLKTTIHFGALLPVVNFRREDHYLSPNIIYEQQGSFSYLHLGLYYGSDIWTVGMWYRVDDAIVASLGMNVSKFRIGYSYDYGISQFKTMSDNAHELSIGYQFEFPRKHKIKNTYKGKCPKFQRNLF
ncbi:PorP/SprF family type IX secretion system membrane protein [Fulvivirga sp.]|uniref:PorP/SprF family type IX secretion system membrane protein n=1 Tax=Fulvivirga sp. TaxID=1931237 RepID=UPI0032EC21DB